MREAWDSVAWWITIGEAGHLACSCRGLRACYAPGGKLRVPFVTVPASSSRHWWSYFDTTRLQAAAGSPTVACLLAAPPLRRLRLTHAPESAGPAFKSLRAIAVREPVGPGVLAAIAQCRQLESLELSVGDEWALLAPVLGRVRDLRLVLASPAEGLAEHLPTNLAFLSLKGPGCSAELAVAAAARGAARLQLEGPFGDEVARAVTARTRDVAISGHSLSAAGVEALACARRHVQLWADEPAEEPVLVSCRSLAFRGVVRGRVAVLDLTDAQIGHANFVAMLDGLVRLELRGNRLNDKAAGDLQHLRLQYLGLADNFLTDHGAGKLGEVASWGLDLGLNQLSAAPALPPRSWLGLRGNAISDAKDLVRSEWRFVDLRENLVDAATAKAWRGGARGPRVLLDGAELPRTPDERGTRNLAPEEGPRGFRPRARPRAEPVARVEEAARDTVSLESSPKPGEWEDTKNLLSWLESELDARAS